jgi:hypothetical protein
MSAARPASSGEYLPHPGLLTLELLSGDQSSIAEVGRFFELLDRIDLTGPHIDARVRPSTLRGGSSHGWLP